MRKQIFWLLFLFCYASCSSVTIKTGIDDKTGQRYFIINNSTNFEQLDSFDVAGNWFVDFGHLENLDGVKFYYGEPIKGKHGTYYSKEKAANLVKGQKYIVLIGSSA